MDVLKCVGDAVTHQVCSFPESHLRELRLDTDRLRQGLLAVLLGVDRLQDRAAISRSFPFGTNEKMLRQK